MSKNIKEIGKELMGKSLNSFHRKTGLTQLEKNNEMQDGILNGILSQVDDAYIEKTEQSNVIHLDGSGDGIVVLDSIEGNTIINNIKDFTPVNIVSDNIQSIFNNGVLTYKAINNYEGALHKSNMLKIHLNHSLKDNTAYTFVVNCNDNCNVRFMSYDGTQVSTTIELTKGLNKKTFTKNTLENTDFHFRIETNPNNCREFIYSDFMIIEGNCIDNEINYSEGLQSSFEEKVNDEGKYEIEILSNNSNLLSTIEVKQNHTYNETNPFSVYVSEGNQCSSKPIYIKHLQNKYIHIQRTLGTMENTHYASLSFYDEFYNKIRTSYDNAVEVKQLVPSNAWYCAFRCKSDNKVLYLGEYRDYYIEPKQNKIKLLINEPLRAVDNAKDRLCVKDGKLTIERNTFLHVLNGQEIWNINDSLNTSNTTRYYTNTLTIPMTLNSNGISDKIPYITGGGKDNMTCIYVHSTVNRIDIRKLNTDNRWTTLEELKTWLRNNNVTLVLKRLEPVYEEVLNEYGEPILLEGYENGTLYIDSAIVPTTTVRYTPKMESFKTLKEVENNNIMLTNDVNDNIIPYMMDVDLMIMEKEMALMSHKNIRKMEVLDMTSMQKRTQDMLERLIKGKTLTEQECKTRVTTYLHAGKITDEQAEELMLLIDEVYA